MALEVEQLWKNYKSVSLNTARKRGNCECIAT